MGRTDLERIAILEQQVLDMKEDVHETRKKVSELHDLMMQAKGARWAILAVGGFAGFLSSFIPTAIKSVPWFSALPK